MQVYAARHEKMKMAHKMKAKNDFIREFNLSVKDGVQKKSRVEDGKGSSSKEFEEHKKALEEVERKFILKSQECDKLKTAMKKAKSVYRTKIRNLEKQLKEENTQRLGWRFSSKDAM